MPWCPRCDETFPEGPTCPRCRSPLVDVGEAAKAPEGQTGSQQMPQLKVPRRLRRAFDRMDRDPAPPRQLLALAIACVLFAGGFVLGRIGAVSPQGPAVQVPLSSTPLELPVEGFVEYIGRVSSAEPALVRHDLATGAVDHAGRFSLPSGSLNARTLATDVTSYDQSVSVLLDPAEGDSFVGAFPAGRPLPLWVEGIEAAWESPGSLLVLVREGELVRWTFDGRVRTEPVPGDWTDVVPAPGGAVVEGVDAGTRIVASRTQGEFRTVMTVPEGARILAAAPNASRLLVEISDELHLWDGTTLEGVRAEGFEAVGAAFSPSGDHVAMTMIERGRPDGSTPVHIAVADPSGGVAFTPVTTWTEGQSCRAAPVWEDSEAWVYVAPGDGAVYAVEAGGGRVQGAPARLVGCGLTWVN